MTIVIVKEDYGEKFAGNYQVKVITWREARELLRRAMKSKDPTEYIEDLVAASVTGPDNAPLTKEKLAELPSGLMRRLMDETLRLNDISRQESAFLST